MQPVRMPSNAALVTGYAVACRRDYATSAVKTPAPRALRQLACCNTLASQSKVAAEHRCGSLQTSLVPQECIKTTHLRIQTGQARRLRREQPCQTRLERGRQNSICRRGGSALPDPTRRGGANRIAVG